MHFVQIRLISMSSRGQKVRFFDFALNLCTDHKNILQTSHKSDFFTKNALISLDKI